MAGVAKAYGLTPDYVLYEMSYANCIMYSAVLPSYKRKGNGQGGGEQDRIDVDDPRNRDKVKRFLDNIE